VEILRDVATVDAQRQAAAAQAASEASARVGET
jgi:hypothetical protein